MNSGPVALTEKAKRFALDAISMYAQALEGQREAALPEVLVENSRGERRIVVVHGGADLQSGTTEDHVVAGRQLLEQLRDHPDVARYATLAYDAHLTSDGEKVCAIVVEMLERGVTHTLAQRYSRGKDGKIQLIGEPLRPVRPHS